MNTSYRFTSDEEPTEKELSLLMDEMIKDVKIRAKKAELNIEKIQEKYREEIIQYQLSKQNRKI